MPDLDDIIILKNQEVVLRQWQDVEKLAQDPEVRKAAGVMVEARNAHTHYSNGLITKYSDPNTPPGLMLWLYHPTPNKSQTIAISPDESTQIGKLFQELSAANNRYDEVIERRLIETGGMERLKKRAEELGHGATPSLALDQMIKYVRTNVETVPEAPPELGQLKPQATPATQPAPKPAGTPKIAPANAR